MELSSVCRLEVDNKRTRIERVERVEEDVWRRSSREKALGKKEQKEGDIPDYGDYNSLQKSLISPIVSTSELPSHHLDPLGIGPSRL